MCSWGRTLLCFIIFTSEKYKFIGKNSDQCHCLFKDVAVVEFLMCWCICWWLLLIESSREGEGKRWCSPAVHPSGWHWGEHARSRAQQWSTSHSSRGRRIPSPRCVSKHLWDNCSQCCSVNIWQLGHQEGHCLPADWRLQKEVCCNFEPVTTLIITVDDAAVVVNIVYDIMYSV